MTAATDEPLVTHTGHPFRTCLLCGDGVFGGPNTHPCCDHWAGLGYSRCPACRASRAAQNTRDRRRDAHQHDASRGRTT